jgi:hypothetical protein
MDDTSEPTTAAAATGLPVAAPAALPPVDVEIIEAKRLMTMIPHRYPFLLVDRVIDVRRDHSATGIKNVTVNENFFLGHFPGHPVMPGVLIVEAMAQTAAAFVIETLDPGKAIPIVYRQCEIPAPGGPRRSAAHAYRQEPAARQCVALRRHGAGGWRSGGGSLIHRHDRG